MRVITNTNVSSKLTFEGNDPSGRSRWASVLRAAHANPFWVLTPTVWACRKPSRACVCGLQARPSRGGLK